MMRDTEDRILGSSGLEGLGGSIKLRDNELNHHLRGSIGNGKGSISTQMYYQTTQAPSTGDPGQVVAP